jgi:hypothetical protein
MSPISFLAVINSVRDNSLYIITLLAAAINFFPAFVMESAIEDSIFAEAVSSMSNRLASMFILSLLVPISLDNILDIATEMFKSSESRNERRQRRSVYSSVSCSELYMAEVALCVMGLAAVPISAFLPDSIPNSALLSVCLKKVAQTLMTGAFVTYLSRYVPASTRLRQAALNAMCPMAIFSSFGGGILMTYASNTTRANFTADPKYKAGAFFQSFAAAIVLVMAVYCLYMSVLRWIYRHILTSSKTSPVGQGTRCQDEGCQDTEHQQWSLSGCQREYVLSARCDRFDSPFLVAYCTIIIVFVIISIVLQVTFKITDRDGTTLTLLLLPNMTTTLSLLMSSIRQVKFAAIENLVRLFNSQLSLSRHIH